MRLAFLSWGHITWANIDFVYPHAEKMRLKTDQVHLVRNFVCRLTRLQNGLNGFDFRGASSLSSKVNVFQVQQSVNNASGILSHPANKIS